MGEFYSNPNGKLRPPEEDSKAKSELRRNWFREFEARLRRKNPELFEGVTLVIVGSVAQDMANSGSDIDVIIKTSSADELKGRLVRAAIHDLLTEMKRSGELVYEVDAHDNGASHVLNPLAIFRRGNHG